MATNHGHEGVEPRNPEVTFDRTDLSARGILIFFLVLAIFAVGVHLTVLGLYVGMTRITDKHDPEQSPLAPRAVTPRSGILTNTANVNIQRFPEPRLQNDDTGDMTRFLQKQAAALSAAPFQDEQGNIHMPIEQAMKAAMAKLPVRAGGAVPPEYPGAHRDYSYPTAPDAGAIQADEKMRSSEPSAAR
jgi:hypothetical protein